MSRTRNRRIAVTLTLASVGLVALSASPASAVREDCNSNAGCGWRNAYFATIVSNRGAIGDYRATTAWDNQISSILNRSTLGRRANWSDFAGSTARVCVPPGYENSNMAGTNLQDKISYLQITNSAC